MSKLETLYTYSNPKLVLKLARSYYKKHRPATTTTTACNLPRKENKATLIGSLGSKKEPYNALYVSTRKNKKYMIQLLTGITANNSCKTKTIHFGQLPYQDYTKHLDKTRRNRYLKRATNIKGKWANDPYSANSLAIHLLW